MMNDYYYQALLSLGWREITLWSRLVNGVWQHNHIESGHADKDKPKGRKEGEWLRLHSFLDKSNTVLY